MRPVSNRGLRLRLRTSDTRRFPKKPSSNVRPAVRMRRLRAETYDDGANDMKQLLQSLAITSWIICLVPARADTSAYFRANGGVVSSDVPLPEELGPKTQVWRQEMAPGHSTPCVTGSLLVVTTYSDEQLATVALDRRTGDVVWRKTAPHETIEEVHRIGSPASASVASDGERIYTFFGSYGILCYDLAGELVWQKPMGPFQDEFGAASSPILVGGKLIINQDHDVDSFLAALDAETGEEIWKTPRVDAVRSYATPIVWRRSNVAEILVAGALRLTAYAADTGEPLWWVDGLARIVNTTPAIGDNGLVYVASWSPGGDAGGRISMESWTEACDRYDKNGDSRIVRSELQDDSPVSIRFFRIDLDQDGGLIQQEWERHARVFERAQNSVLAVKPGGRGNVSDANVVWRYRRGIPYVPSPLVLGDTVFLVKNGGIVTSLRASDGKLLRQARAPGAGDYYASPVAGDQKIYLASRDGVVTVLSADPQWKALSSHDFQESIMATPAISDGSVFLRTEEAVYCFAK